MVVADFNQPGLSGGGTAANSRRQCGNHRRSFGIDGLDLSKKKEIMKRDGVRIFGSSFVVAAAIVGSAICAPSVAVARAPADQSSFHSVTPCRLLDTRREAPGALVAGQATDIAVVGRCGVPIDATVAVLTVTAVDATGAGYVSAWPSGATMPEASVLNVDQGETRANTSLLLLGSGGAVAMQASIATHLLVDVSGYFTPAPSGSNEGRFVPTAIRRLIDTRATGRPGPGSIVHVALGAAVPDDAIAVAVNITTTHTTGTDYFTAFAGGGERPNASVLNADGANQTRASSSIVPVGDGIDVYTDTGNHVIVDITGYFTGASAPISTDGLFVATTPTRLVDTRRADGGTGGPRLYLGGGREFDPQTVTGGAVAAIAANWTVDQTAGAGWWLAYPARTSFGDASLVNADAAGQSISNLGIVPVSTAGVAVHAAEEAQVVVDVTGWFTGQPRSAEHAEAPSNDPPPVPVLPGCAPTGRSAVADKMAQRYWLCQDGAAITEALPMTTGSFEYALPPVGTYRVFTKLRYNSGLHGEVLHRFVAFYRTPRGNRIAFHQVVNQDPATVGDLDRRGASAGCFRVSQANSIQVWEFLQIGDPVIVITP